jgi:D-glycero-alpha-D-manno-heptose-7-phosphate kinase
MRISYAGGGTDFESYYADNRSLVVSAAIDKYFYVFISPNGNGSLQISSADYRSLYRVEESGEVVGVGDEMKHAKAAVAKIGITEGYSIFMASNVPAGTGLGSSSAVAVALVKGLCTLKHLSVSKAELAEMACDIELAMLKMPIGRQDQYASAFGGLNAIHFDSDGIEVEPLNLTSACLSKLERATMLFYTGLTHDSSAILREQQARTGDMMPKNIEQQHTIKQLAVEARESLLAGEPDRLGPILDRTWEAKKALSEAISNPLIDKAYRAARLAGALGGKIAGAGGGGFLVLYCPPEKHPAVTRSLHDLGLIRFDFHFDFGGARVLMNNVAS